MLDDCKLCPLHELAKKVVPGTGPEKAEIAVIGEAPGPDENRSGKPFIGMAGKRLEQLLSLSKIKKSDCWVDNIVHHMPTDDGRSFRKPKASEVKACLPHLMETLGKVQPKVILALGDVALQVFLPKKALRKVHGLTYEVQMEWGTVKVLPLYHPSYYNRAPAARVFISQDYANISKSLACPITKPDMGTWFLLQPKSQKELLDILIEMAYRSREWAVDFETTGLDPYQDRILGMSMSCGTDPHFYIDINQLTESDKVETARTLYKFLGSSKIKKILFNAKFEMKFIMALLGRDKEIRNLEDASLLAYLLHQVIYKTSPDGGEVDSYPMSLKICVLRNLGIEMTELDSLMGTGKKKRDVVQIPVEALAEYGTADSVYTYHLWKKLSSEMPPELMKLYRKIDLPLVAALARMELAGVEIDWKAVDELDKHLTEQIDSVLPTIYELAGREFNVGSNPQLRDVLFADLKLQGSKKTATGYSTDKESLKELKDVHPIVQHILNFRALSKLKSTYTDNLKKLKHPVTGRVHVEFKQTRTATGRFSSGSDEDDDTDGTLNAQNIPKKSDDGKKIRRTVTVPPGFVLFKADASQEELRLLAHFSQDPNMLKVYREDGDIHTETTQSLYLSRDDYKEHFAAYRDTAKIFNFGGLAYLGSPETIAASTGAAVDEVAELLDKLIAYYSGVPEYQKKQLRTARLRGYVTTIWGRRLYIPEALVNDKWAQGKAAKKAANYSIQGSGGEIIRHALVRIDEYLMKHKLRSYLFNQVHDEVSLAVWEPELAEVARIVNDALAPPILTVPLKTEMAIGPNWVDTKSYKLEDG